MSMFEQLAAEFPKSAVSWRAQTVTKAGDKALALAYIDARDVMNRLDDVCGPENWEDSYVETAKGRVIATIKIWTNDRWVSKSDGAGDTDVEGDKGGISDAFKRAAVKWGIGRYLYDMPATWAPCESYQDGNKYKWSKWKGDPWDSVRMPSKAPTQPQEAPKPEAPKMTTAQRKELYASLKNDLSVESAKGTGAITRFMNDAGIKEEIIKLDGWAADFRKEAAEIYRLAKAAEEAFDQPVQVKSKLPNFDHLDSTPSPDPIDELIGENNG